MKPGDAGNNIVSPVKELTKLNGFDDIGSLKSVVSPLKELNSLNGFDDIGKLKDIFKPLKDDFVVGKLTPSKSGEDSKNDGKSGESKEDKSSDESGKENKE